MKKNQKGFTLVEVIVTFCLVTTISFLLFQLVLSLKNIYTSSDYKTVLLISQGNMTRRMNDDLFDMIIEKIDQCTDAETTTGSTMCIKFTLYDSTLDQDEIRKLEVFSDKIVYDSYTMTMQKGSTIGTPSIAVSHFEDKSIKYNSILKMDIPVTNKLTEGDFGIHIIAQYNGFIAEVNKNALTSYEDITTSEAS
jgi:hypothetical protein